ncbi:MAG: pseudouridine synthase [Gammaproteobacteria bacterium]|nr:pseudouridine synthase [Gammaproteobacteria bacterium]
MSEKLQKVLARAGLGSRREMEIWIRDGRVRVNGKSAQLGDRVVDTDMIWVDGRRLAPDALRGHALKVLCYHKPAGEICTRHDPEGRPTVFDSLPKRVRWISIGRLDFNTSGLLLFTTDGELARRLMHPSYEIEREYAVRILGEVDQAMLKRLTCGIELEDGPAKFKRVRDAGGEGANHWYHVVLGEGRTHEVRRLWESQNVRVSRLVRIRFGPVQMPRGLRTGGYADLEPALLQSLLQATGLPPTNRTPPQTQRSRHSSKRQRHTLTARKRTH